MISSLTRRALLAYGAAGAGAVMMPRVAHSSVLDRMIWTAADIGSSAYVEATAVANALIAKHGSTIRVIPSGTSIGRMTQLSRDNVSLGFMANEAYFATEAIYDFSARNWGPQDLRALLGREAIFGIVTTKRAGIKTIADMKGRSIARIQAHPSTNFKIEGVLSFAGLTWDDVRPVQVPGYSQGLQAVLDGTVEAAGAVVGASTLREIEASPAGIAWLPVPADDTAGWGRLNASAPLFAPTLMTDGPGASEEAPVQLVGYRYPIISVYAKEAEDRVYDMTRALVETYPLYRDAAPAMAAYDVNKAGHPPYDAPCHDGARRYFREIGVWNDQDEDWNRARLQRLEKVKAVWADAIDQAARSNLSEDDWPAFWEQARTDNLKQL